MEMRLLFTSELSDVKIVEYDQHTGLTKIHLNWTTLHILFPQEAINVLVTESNKKKTW